MQWLQKSLQKSKMAQLEIQQHMQKTNIKVLENQEKNDASLDTMLTNI